MQIVNEKIENLIPYARNPRVNQETVDGIAASISEFGFQQPIVVDASRVIVAGHTRYRAAQKLGLSEVPIVIASELTEQQIKAYRILDNKLAEKSHWDMELLSLELDDLEEFNFDAFDIESWGLPSDSIGEPKSGSEEKEMREVFEIIVSCESEGEQQELFEEFSEKGLACRLLTL